MSNPATPLMIFGYGSLMDDESLRATVPNAQNVKPAYIKGFRREFNKLDPIGWKSSNLDLAGIPMCAVDVASFKDNERVNGVTFTFEPDYVAELKRREVGYELIETAAYDFHTDEATGLCFVFSCNSNDGEYLFGNPAQERYLEVCLRAAKEFGDDFYREFLATTYIGDKTLEQVPGLIK